ncbi:MAG: hypothetical protein H7Z40_08255 [Phycisphaerae bacterium]|nr:hypothetical protein [Gemmatimonadaceae bacterium]
MPFANWSHSIRVVWLASLLGAGALGAQAQPRSKATPPSDPRPPLVGTLSAQAGQVAGTPTMPSRNSGITGGGPRSIRTRPLRTGGYVPLLVRDAPMYQRGGSTLAVGPVSTPVVSPPAYYPTAAAPVWRIVPEEHPVQGWRLVDVDDVICFPTGACRAVTTRVMARWIPTLRGYGFRDRVGRLWQVE